jgi:eukaryotic-like serine/threonine-protein kinase
MPLERGDRLGPYEVQCLLGIGGMGEVYRACDARLGRDVALKVISPKLVGDEASRHRFQREARAASALNHPAIVTVYDVGDTDGVSWIAMEWVEGRTLRAALSDGPIAVREAWSIARQVAEGLAVAHARGIVHRDLKPENVMLVHDGRVKILDFGLARQTIAEHLQGSASMVDTMAPPPGATVDGVILGTVGYMSPEQAAGQPVDFRSDQFALGLLAYEMLAGRRAFVRPTAVETLTAVIREEPAPLSSVRTGVPEALEQVIARCLAKHPADRFASTRDLAAALEAVAAGSGSVTALADAAMSATATRGPAVPSTGTATQPSRRWPTVSLAIAVVALAALGIAGWYRLRVPAAATIDSLAVLPFENRSVDAGSEYLGDELTESLINQMSRIPALKVMARATVFRLREIKDPQEAGRKLGVGAVLSGSVARRGNQLVISAELIETGTGAQLWGERYERPFADLIQVQNTIASEIVEGLRLRLSHQDRRTLGAQGTDNADAYELFLKARYLLLSGREEDELEARRLYQQALEKDAAFVDARLGLAATYARSAGEGFAPPKEAWPRALDEIRKVLAIDPGNVAGRAALAAYRFLYEWDWATAEREFEQLSTDPRLFRGIQYHPVAAFFWARGWPDRAVSLLERALRLDPGNLESRVMLGDFLAHAGRLDDAIEYYRAIAEVAPADARAFFGLSEVLRRRGDVPGAVEALRKAYELSEEEAGTRALAGARSEADLDKAEVVVARARLRDLEDLAKERYISPLDFARLHAVAGGRDRAFEWLDRAVAERSSMLVTLKVDHAWDQIRDDPRFAGVVRRVGIP